MNHLRGRFNKAKKAAKPAASETDGWTSSEEACDEDSSGDGDSGDESEGYEHGQNMSAAHGKDNVDSEEEDEANEDQDESVVAGMEDDSPTQI